MAYRYIYEKLADLLPAKIAVFYKRPNLRVRIEFHHENSPGYRRFLQFQRMGVFGWVRFRILQRYERRIRYGSLERNRLRQMGNRSRLGRSDPFMGR